jgi:26S proteasome regulatory subunit T5
MTVGSGVNFDELARSTDEFNGAQLKAVCVEAGMIALREGASQLNHEHFHQGIAEGTFGIPYLVDSPILTRYFPVQSKKKNDLMYFA